MREIGLPNRRQFIGAAHCYRTLFSMGAIPVERPSAQDTESETTEADMEL
jgi:hypothetical protein